MVIPPKHAISEVVGYLKGKSAIHLAWVYGERQRNGEVNTFRLASGSLVLRVVIDDQEGISD